MTLDIRKLAEERANILFVENRTGALITPCQLQAFADAVLEEAAKEADRIAGNYKDFRERERKGAGTVSAAIRALKGKP